MEMLNGKRYLDILLIIIYYYLLELINQLLNGVQIDFGSGILYGGSDTKGFMSSAYDEPFIMWAGGNGSSDDSVPKWYIGIKGTHKSIYNLATIASEANAAYNLLVNS